LINTSKFDLKNIYKKISIIIPCYNEEEVLYIFYKEILNILKYEIFTDMSYELLFIDDGSKDKTLHLIKELSEKDANIKYISFSRNFGKDSAIFAGLKNCTGDYIVTMDADMQDPPNLLPEMLNIIVTEEYDMVATRRVSRKGEPIIRSFFARMFYRLINKISKTDIVDGARDFRLMTRQCVDAILSMPEYNRFTKGIFSWIGFKTKLIEYKNIERAAGETKWSFWQLFLYSLEGITAFSTVPLAIASISGIVFCLLAFCGISIIITKTLIWGDPVAGYPSIVCIILLVGGMNLFCIGIIGKYLDKTYLEVKNRPIYLISKTNIEKGM